VTFIFSRKLKQTFNFPNHHGYLCQLHHVLLFISKLQHVFQLYQHVLDSYCHKKIMLWKLFFYLTITNRYLMMKTIWKLHLNSAQNLSWLTLQREMIKISGEKVLLHYVIITD